MVWPPATNRLVARAGKARAIWSNPVARREPETTPKPKRLADSVGIALLVLLDRLAPPSGSLVLHDMFDVPFG